MLIRIEPGPWRVEFTNPVPPTEWLGVAGLSLTLWVVVGIAYNVYLYWGTPDEDIADGDILFTSDWYILAAMILTWPWLLWMQITLYWSNAVDQKILREGNERGMYE